jgi:hypothetical protein
MTAPRAVRVDHAAEISVLRAQVAELGAAVARLCEHLDFDAPKIVADAANHVTPKMAMHIAGVSRSAIQKKIKKKQIKSTKVGNRTLIEVDSLLEHLSVQTGKLRTPNTST